MHQATFCKFRTRTIISHSLYIYYPIFHCGLYCRVVNIKDNLCNKQGHSSIFEAQNLQFIIKNGFKSRAGYNGGHTIPRFLDQSILNTNKWSRFFSKKCAHHLSSLWRSTSKNFWTTVAPVYATYVQCSDSSVLTALRRRNPLE